MATMAILGTQDGSRILSSTLTRIPTAILAKAEKAKGGWYVQALRSTAVCQTSIRDGTHTRPNCGCNGSRNQTKPIGVPWESRGRAGKPRQLRTLQTYMRCVYKKVEKNRRNHRKKSLCREEFTDRECSVGPLSVDPSEKVEVIFCDASTDDGESSTSSHSSHASCQSALSSSSSSVLGTGGQRGAQILPTSSEFVEAASSSSSSLDDIAVEEEKPTCRPIWSKPAERAIEDVQNHPITA
jgi:hypothetical protein